jgi:hypothetical protein
MLNFRIQFSILQQIMSKDRHEKQRKSFVVFVSKSVPRSNDKKGAAWALKKRRPTNAGAGDLGMKIPNYWEENFGDFF